MKTIEDFIAALDRKIRSAAMAAQTAQTFSDTEFCIGTKAGLGAARALAADMKMECDGYSKRLRAALELMLAKDEAMANRFGDKWPLDLSPRNAVNQAREALALHKPL